jgi:hypothetical protein
MRKTALLAVLGFGALLLLSSANPAEGCWRLRKHDRCRAVVCKGDDAIVICVTPGYSHMCCGASTNYYWQKMSSGGPGLMCACRPDGDHNTVRCLR